MEFSDPAVEELARRLRMGRASANLTQAQAAEIAQISQSALSLYEKAKREPHAMALMRLAKAYGVSADWLLGLSETMALDKDQLQ